MRCRRSLALAALLLLCPALPAGAARLGAELRLNESTGWYQIEPVLAARPDGSFLAVWNDTYDAIVARLFAADGRPLGGDVGVGVRTLPTAGRYLYQPRAVALADGGFAVVWMDGLTLFSRVLGADGAPRGPASLLSVAEESYLYTSTHPPSIAAAPDGGFVVAWQHAMDLPPAVFGRRELVRWRRYAADGSPAGPQVEVAPSNGVADWPRVAVDAAGRVAVTWQSGNIRLNLYDAEGNLAEGPVEIGHGSTHGGGIPRFEPDGELEVTWQSGAACGLRRFAPSGAPLAETKWLHNTDEPFSGDFVLHAAVADGAGHRLLVWSQRSTRDPDGGVHARLYDTAWDPLGPPFLLNAAAQAHQLDGAAAGLERGFLTAWAGGEHESGAGVPLGHEGRCTGDGSFFGIFARHLDPEASGAAPEALLLGDGRFALEVEWRTGGEKGTGRPLPHSDESGAFWFFGPDNPELLVKLLDGRAVNGHFWVFHAAATSVDYTLTVTDLDTGRQRRYEKRVGPLASAVDTSAFAAPGTPAGPDKSVCAEGLPLLHLGYGDFYLTVTWRDPKTGASGRASGQALTRDGGLFFFFGNANPEILVKMVDGRPVNGHWWFFHAALTDLEYEIVVRESDTGAERTYKKPAGTLGGGTDTRAF